MNRVIRVKHLLPIILSVAIITGIGLTAFPVSTGTTTENPQGVQYHSLVEVYYNGELLDASENTYMNEGANWTVDELFVSDSASVVDYMVLGNGSAPTATDTALDSAWDSSGLAPASISWSRFDVGNVTASYPIWVYPDNAPIGLIEWTATSDGCVVIFGCIFHNISSGQDTTAIQVGSSATAPTQYFAARLRFLKNFNSETALLTSRFKSVGKHNFTTEKSQMTKSTSQFIAVNNCYRWRIGPCGSRNFVIVGKVLQGVISV